jgi:hypothetical protein
MVSHFITGLCGDLIPSVSENDGSSATSYDGVAPNTPVDCEWHVVRSSFPTYLVVIPPTPEWAHGQFQV